jgi:hypothetical protein
LDADQRAAYFGGTSANQIANSSIIFYNPLRQSDYNADALHIGPTLSTSGTAPTYDSQHPTISYGSATTKYMKYFIQSTAVAAEVDGVVFYPGTGGAITGSKIGEFTGIEVVAGTGDDTGKGVLLVPAADFNGSALEVDDPVVALARTSTFTTGIEPGVIVEE